MATAVGLGKGTAQVNGAGAQLTVADTAGLRRAADFGKADGAPHAMGTWSTALCGDQAVKHGWRVGSSTKPLFTDGSAQRFTVGAIYQHADRMGDYVIRRQAWEPHRTQDSVTLVAVSLRPGASVSDGKAVVTRVAAGHGNPTVRTRAEYAKSSASGIDTTPILVYALLALAVLIAQLGITNALTLAVHERTRKGGLLRAVEQTRAQLRAVVRWQSVPVAAFGTVGGPGLGAFLRRALVRGADSSGVSAFSVPPVRSVVVPLVGLMAGLGPTRRAARPDVRRAVAAESAGPGRARAGPDRRLLRRSCCPPSKAAEPLHACPDAPACLLRASWTCPRPRHPRPRRWPLRQRSRDRHAAFTDR